MDNDDNLSVEGYKPENTLISLNDGLNLIGYPSLEEKDISIVLNDITNSLNNVLSYENNNYYSYSPLKQNNALEIIKPGFGYFVNVNESTSLLIS